MNNITAEKILDLAYTSQYVQTYEHSQDLLFPSLPWIAATVKINHESPVPLHAQVESLIRSFIDDEEYRDGKLLPKEADLARRLGVSRNTVRQAMTKLVHEGLVVRKRSVGSVVAGRFDTKNGAGNFATFPEKLHERENELRNLDVDVSWIKCDMPTSKALDIPLMTRILSLERLKGSDEGPVVLFVSYFHPRLGLDEDCNFEKSLYDLLDKDYSIVPSKSLEDISALAADRKVAHALGINVGDPVLLRERRVLDPGGRPIERNLCYYRSDRYTFSVNFNL